jgi:hypothetical protein
MGWVWGRIGAERVEWVVPIGCSTPLRINTNFFFSRTPAVWQNHIVLRCQTASCSSPAPSYEGVNWPESIEIATSKNLGDGVIFITFFACGVLPRNE